MPRILLFSSGPQDWQRLLADPAKHWKSGYSARTLAHSWESACGFPAEVEQPFVHLGPPLENLVPLLAIPEFTCNYSPRVGWSRAGCLGGG
jgi:hypothetical protein